ncbi:hypothetical protein BGX38DRAFT_1181089 [Terfezia claveryi]|nr:hypothetical protein BGX38DRAFT_1181089 [Terfezia claveryi]
MMENSFRISRREGRVFVLTMGARPYLYLGNSPVMPYSSFTFHLPEPGHGAKLEGLYLNLVKTACCSLVSE